MAVDVYSVEFSGSLQVKPGEKIAVDGCVVSGESFQVLIGNREWLKQNAVAVPKNVNDQMVDQENLGRSAVLAAINGKEVFSMPEFMI